MENITYYIYVNILGLGYANQDIIMIINLRELRERIYDLCLLDFHLTFIILLEFAHWTISHRTTILENSDKNKCK